MGESARDLRHVRVRVLMLWEERCESVDMPPPTLLRSVLGYEGPRKLRCCQVRCARELQGGERSGGKRP